MKENLRQKERQNIRIWKKKGGKDKALAEGDMKLFGIENVGKTKIENLCKKESGREQRAEEDEM